MLTVRAQKSYFSCILTQPMPRKIRFVDLFCGIGGFRIGFSNAVRELGLESQAVFASDIDLDCQAAYSANFGEMPTGDISRVDADSIPDHDVLLAGFPCQPFSIIGKMNGFEDARGTLFFDIARIITRKRPRAFILENVKLLRSHNKGRTLKRILGILKDLGYKCDFKILNALDFGLPQKRERIFIVGFDERVGFEWPCGAVPMQPLSVILQPVVDARFFATDYIIKKRHAKVKSYESPSIWHENKSGHVGVYPYSCALRAGASYNYLLVDGKRRMTPRELLRLQGFPESFQIVCTESQTRKQAGNSVAVPVVQAVASAVIAAIDKANLNVLRTPAIGSQPGLFSDEAFA